MSSCLTGGETPRPHLSSWAPSQHPLPGTTATPCVPPKAHQGPGVLGGSMCSLSWEGRVPWEAGQSPETEMVAHWIQEQKLSPRVVLRSGYSRVKSTSPNSIPSPGLVQLHPRSPVHLLGTCTCTTCSWQRTSVFVKQKDRSAWPQRHSVRPGGGRELLRSHFK